MARKKITWKLSISICGTISELHYFGDYRGVRCGFVKFSENGFDPIYVVQNESWWSRQEFNNSKDLKKYIDNESGKEK